MSELKATPGPWKVSTWISQQERGLKPMVAAGGVTIAITHPSLVCPEQECEANAHLMGAAHRMYRALENLTACISETRGSNANDALCEAFEAMKQARGEV